MEITVELDESLVDELDEEAQLQGFDDRGAYLRWVIANRPMSELATSQAPAVASRVSELEERMKLVERQLDLSAPTDAAEDLADETTPSSAGGGLASEGSGASLEGSGGGGTLETDSGGASLEEPVEQDTEPVDLEDPTTDEEPDEEEDGAQDDEIAEAIDDIDLEDEAEDGGDGVDSDEKL
jgi:hypothetical protein